MANELSILIKVNALKGKYRHDIAPGVVQHDMAVGEGGTPGSLAATTASQSISFGSVAPGYVYIRNLSTSNTVKLTTTSNLSFCSLGPTMQALIPKGSDGWKLVASTAGGSANVDIRGFST